jgi:hypothetical protein
MAVNLQTILHALMQHAGDKRILRAALDYLEPLVDSANNITAEPGSGRVRFHDTLGYLINVVAEGTQSTGRPVVINRLYEEADGELFYATRIA